MLGDVTVTHEKVKWQHWLQLVEALKTNGVVGTFKNEKKKKNQKERAISV